MAHPRPVMRPGLALAAAAIVGVAGLAPAGAADEVEGLVVEAQRSAWVDVELRQDRQVRPSGVEVVGGGRWASVLVLRLEPRTGRPSVAAGVTVLREVSDEPVPQGFGDLVAGRYRVVVLAERPVRVAFTTDDGGDGLLVRATRPLATAYSSGAQRVTGPGPSAASVRLPGRVPAGFTAQLAGRLDTDRAGTFLLCAAAPREECRGQLLPLSPPSPLPPQPDVAPPSASSGGASHAWAQPVDRPRDGLLAVDGVSRGDAELRLAVLAFRLP